MDISHSSAQWQAISSICFFQFNLRLNFTWYTLLVAMLDRPLTGFAVIKSNPLCAENAWIHYEIIYKPITDHLQTRCECKILQLVGKSYREWERERVLSESDCPLIHSWVKDKHSWGQKKKLLCCPHPTKIWKLGRSVDFFFFTYRERVEFSNIFFQVSKWGKLGRNAVKTHIQVLF